MKEYIEFNLTPFEQMMESVSVELDDFEIDDVFQEGKRFEKLKQRLDPINASFDYDPKMKKLEKDLDAEPPKHFKIIRTIKLIFKSIIGLITGFIRNIGYMKPVKISKYGTVFVNKTELEYCYKTLKVLRDINSNYNDIVIGFLLELVNLFEKNPDDDELFPDVHTVLNELGDIDKARKVRFPLVSSSKYGEAMTIQTLNQLSKDISDTINGVIKKIREHNFLFDVEEKDDIFILKVNGKEVYRTLGKTWDDRSMKNAIENRLEYNIEDFTMRLGHVIDDLKIFHKEMVDDINNLKNIGDRKIDSPTYEYMI